jgi:peptidoglycan hydrolase-like protein with peptidoglycan-binding domain
MRVFRFDEFMNENLPGFNSKNLPDLKYGSSGESVKILQKHLIDLGFLKISKPSGNFLTKTQKAVSDFQKSNGLLPANGVFNKKTRSKLGASLKSAGANLKNSPASAQTQGISLAPQFKKYNVSAQVKAQLKYLADNNFISSEKFTILDDKNSKVHTFLPGYELLKTYNVITGKSKGDALKTKTLTDWFKSNWSSVVSKFFKSKSWSETKDYVDSEYFKEWDKKNTPSGAFRRAKSIKNFLNSTFLTTVAQIKYGKRYITWETCDGNVIPFGFHGTEIPARVAVLTGKEVIDPRKANMSFGCINFQEKDIVEISDFIDSNQLSIWLPDETNDIVKLSVECLTGKKTKPPVQINRIDQYYLDRPGLRRGGGLD